MSRYIFVVSQIVNIEIMKNIFYRTFSFFIRKNKGSYPYGHSHKKFVSRFNEPESYTFLIRDSELPTVESDKEISYSHHLKFGMDYKIYKKKLGKPNNFMHQTEPIDRRILYYKFIMGGHRTKCELHFYKDKLFFYCFTFPYLTEENKKEILNILYEKYVNHPIDMENVKIADKNNNILFIENRVELTVNYVALSSEIFSYLDIAKIASETNAQSKNRFYKKELLRML